MRRHHRILLRVIAASVAITIAGCFSRTVENVPAPAPVVQVTPPVVAPAPATQTTTTTVRENNVPAPAIPPAPVTSQSTTTTWDNGTVVERNSVTEPRPGVVEKQTTTTWSDSASAPSETTSVTTSTNP